MWRTCGEAPSFLGDPVKKWIGLALVVLGGLLTYVSWNDPVEGVFTRPVGCSIAVAGAFTIVLGVRDEIIRAIREAGGRTDRE